MKRICKNIHFINKLAKAKTLKQRRKVLQGVTRDQLKAIREIAVNTCKGNLDIPKKTFTKVKRYKNAIRHIANKGAKRNYIVQKGGFLPFLIPIVAKLANGILGGLSQ